MRLNPSMTYYLYVFRIFIIPFIETIHMNKATAAFIDYRIAVGILANI
tara:strand:+ start:352 stop:495 length:144 start_codon:yes stop_codon:yes gene_type:complete